MYQFITEQGVRRTLYGEAPAGAVAFIIAELFYKFHSFTLECAAFLVTWLVLSWAWSAAAKRLWPHRAGARRNAA